jgi:hypothetical protein
VDGPVQPNVQLFPQEPCTYPALTAFKEMLGSQPMDPEKLVASGEGLAFRYQEASSPLW